MHDWLTCGLAGYILGAWVDVEGAVECEDIERKVEKI